ncbi:15357_t:CDS:2, partial [Acaulospora morrowiae]
QSRPCRIAEVVKIPAKLPHNDEMLSEMESIHRTLMLYLWLSYRFQETFIDVDKARELKLQCENAIHESLQTLKIPRKRHRTTTKDIRVLSRLEQRVRALDSKSTDRNIPINPKNHVKNASHRDSSVNINKSTKQEDKLTI